MRFKTHALDFFLYIWLSGWLAERDSRISPSNQHNCELIDNENLVMSMAILILGLPRHRLRGLLIVRKPSCSIFALLDPIPEVKEVCGQVELRETSDSSIPDSVVRCYKHSACGVVFGGHILAISWPSLFL